MLTGHGWELYLFLSLPQAAYLGMGFITATARLRTPLVQALF